MNRILRSEKMLQRWIALLVCVAVPALAFGQHKTESAPKSAPSHQSAPSHSGGGQSHSGGQSHGSSHASTPQHSGASHSAAPSHGNGTAGHANTNAGHGNTNAGHGNATAGHGNANAGHGNTNAGRGNTNAGRGNTNAGRGNANAGRSNTHQPTGTRNVSLKAGGSASLRSNGSIRSINRGGMHISHGVNGGRTVVSNRGGARIVTTGHGGYVQHSYMTRGGRTFYSRTYVSGGVVRVGVYRGYAWGGRTYFGYYPGYWYHPGFYGWGWHPWGVGVYWGVGAWGWGGAPWWGYYGGWWNPYPVYAAPYYWLTDYLIAQQLQAAYAARAEANADAIADDAQASAGTGGGYAQPSASAGVTLTPEVKEAIAEEIKTQLAAQQAQAGASNNSAPAPTNATNQVPPALDPAQRTFVVDTNVTAVANGQECGLTAGDVVTRLTDTPDADNNVNASIAATKKGDCASGVTVAIKVDDLQEMYNHFQEQLTNGMAELAKKQGTGGMPAAPDTGTTASDVPTPPADDTAAKTLQDQQAAADQAEQDVKKETAAGGGGQ